jgi:acyl-CoA thioesterase FadM
MRPAYEGANIRTWVGFKHFLYLAEQAVLDSFRDRGTGPSRLYHAYGLGLSTVESSAHLPAVLDADDEVAATVEATGPGRFAVRLTVAREGEAVTILRGRTTVRLVAEPGAGRTAPVPADLAGIVVGGVRAGTGEPAPGIPLAGAAPAERLGEGGAFTCADAIPYQWCHFSDRMQYSGYVRMLESVVERFLRDRGISVGRMLRERGWIPVVSRVKVALLADAHMEEVLHTRFVVTDVLKGLAFDGRMDCYVARGAELAHVATARIVHGYALSSGPQAGGLATLDGDTIEALTGASA